MSILDYKSDSASLLLELINQRTGHFYENGKRDRILDKIGPLVSERGLSSFLDYYYLLRYGEEAEQEWQRVEHALAVNETYFWREYGQIETAAKVLVPKILNQNPLQRVRIWHAGCATGEEPYTMAITLQEAGLFDRGLVEIVASDFNREAIARARAAVYRPRSFRSIPPDIQERYFTPSEGETFRGEGKTLRLVDDIRRRVQFIHLNLMDANAILEAGPFDFIFCRNVFIYFSSESILQVVGSFHSVLRDPGYLFLSAAESLLRITALFDFLEIEGTFLYTKAKPPALRESPW